MLTVDLLVGVEVQVEGRGMVDNLRGDHGLHTSSYIRSRVLSLALSATCNIMTMLVLTSIITFSTMLMMSENTEERFSCDQTDPIGQY